ncbi:unnamed protein product [marine sediment metagenome]|uniref:Uncharacterized protein n=1 Tax=marine sediment metagenome TaxID=412755 RepID=X0U9H9_9ZZZZ
MTFKTDLIGDLDTFLANDEFAVDVTYNAVTFTGIFDDAFDSPNLDTGQIETTAPQVLVKDSDISGIAQDDTMTINSVVYNVTGIHPDGTGLTTIILSQD